MRIKRDFRGDLADSADCLSDLNGIAFLNKHVLVKAAVNGNDIVVMRDLNSHTHKRIIAHGAYLAVAGSLNRRAFFSFDVDAVMRAPFLERDILHKFIVAIRSENFSGERQNEGGRLRLGLRLDLGGWLGGSGCRCGR